MLPVPRIVETDAVIPLMAALPYEIAMGDLGLVGRSDYDPATQVTIFAGRRDYCTCREDESVGGWFEKSRSDTKKDD